MLETIRIYGRPRLVAILGMGFSSGLPLALSGSTLALWLADAQVSLREIGLFALVAVSYNFKFLWAPLVDRLAIPGLTRRLGRRRSWAILFQAGVALSLLGLSLTDPAAAPVPTALMAVLVAFFSASQDIVVDAYRVELLLPEEQGAGAAATQFGYRLGMIASGAGALYAAAAWGWPAAYQVMAALMLVGVATVLATPEPQVERAPRGGFAETVLAPFRDFALRPRWFLILLFVLVYKMADAVTGHYAGPLYLSLGFSKIEIASISKVFGIIATIVGVALGGSLVYRYGTIRTLFLGAVLQMGSNAMYVAQALAGHDLTVLTATIAFENVAGGIGSAAFVAYLSALCSRTYTATQYALLSALAAFARNFFVSAGGAAADWLGWLWFFVFSIGLPLPGLALLLWLALRTRPEGGLAEEIGSSGR
ncbi:MFS transporter [Aliidongia dinghuensis]|uniref:MFS transporter n=1 Tax=Aliidongia dinghuensis TaxID=1867774 RepID=A0A8J3E569_9PROT|nr:MFS transporter [Aliidongia dinghuensis]GGF33217.1 MFS transporter [Aliidongia dinghuensis]